MHTLFEGHGKCGGGGWKKGAAEKLIEWGTENGMDQEGGVNEQHRETL